MIRSAIPSGWFENDNLFMFVTEQYLRVLRTSNGSVHAHVHVAR